MRRMLDAGMVPMTMAMAMALAACGGMQPSGGNEKRSRTPTQTAVETPTPDANDPGAQSGDQVVAPDDRDHDAALLAELSNPDIEACQASGYVYERRKFGCSLEIKLATSFTCDRAGIRAAFTETGYQIDAVLDAALGKEGYDDDHGEGYVIDQCGETAEGRRLVYFVKRDEDNLIRVREAETHL